MPAIIQASDAEIIGAGKRLTAIGRTVTGWAIRAELGERGQPKRLAAVWQAHQATVSEAEAPPAAAPPPADFTRMADDIRDRVAALWGLGLRVANEQAAEAVAAAHERSSRFRADLDEAETAIERVENERDAALEARSHAERERDQAIGRALAAEARAREAADTIADTIERSAIEKGRLVERAEAATAESEALRIELATMRASGPTNGQPKLVDGLTGRSDSMSDQGV